ncbi:MAG: hypothetical protein KAG97_09940 [Victivallales bacterium]|nr:hypothetical protein [Victivallales bacterium]
MTNPLDELRNTTKSIHKKQEENLKSTKEQRLRQQELMAKNSAQRQQDVQDETKAIADKSKRIKITIMLFLILLLCVLLAFSIRLAISGNYSAIGKSNLASNDKIEMDAKDNEYISLKKIIKKTIADFQKNKEIENIPWYSSLSVGRKTRYFKIMTDLGLNDAWSIRSIWKDSKRERFSIVCAKCNTASLTFDVVYNDDMELRIVKVY